MGKLSKENHESEDASQMQRVHGPAVSGQGSHGGKLSEVHRESQDASRMQRVR